MSALVPAGDLSALDQMDPAVRELVAPNERLATEIDRLLAAAADAPQPEAAREMQGGVRLGDFLDPLSDEPDIPPTAGLRRSSLSPAGPSPAVRAGLGQQR